MKIKKLRTSLKTSLYNTLMNIPLESNEFLSQFTLQPWHYSIVALISFPLTFTLCFFIQETQIARNMKLEFAIICHVALSFAFNAIIICDLLKSTSTNRILLSEPQRKLPLCSVKHEHLQPLVEEKHKGKVRICEIQIHKVRLEKL